MKNIKITNNQLTDEQIEEKIENNDISVFSSAIIQVPVIIQIYPVRTVLRIAVNKKKITSLLTNCRYVKLKQIYFRLLSSGNNAMLSSRSILTLLRTASLAAVSAPFRPYNLKTNFFLHFTKIFTFNDIFYFPYLTVTFI